ncbi:MAG: cation transporter, partial [Prevotella sp.]|nr:cation transporter [Prevotella sp.]
MKRTIPVIGMACASCAANVERRLNETEGVASASVSLPGRSALIDYDPEVVSLETLKSRINDIGYDLVIEADRSAADIERQAYRVLKRRTVLSWVLSVLVMCVSMHWLDLGSRDASNQVSLLLSLANLWFCGREFYIHAGRQLRHRTANMDTLVALSTGISFLFSVFNTYWGDAVWGAHGIAWHT